MAKRKKKARPSFMCEHDQQVALFAWARDAAERQTHIIKRMALEWMHSSLNGVRMSIGLAMKCKRSGMTRGVWDVFIPCPQGGNTARRAVEYVGLYIEMKVPGNKLSPEQIEFGEFVAGLGYQVAVCYSWQEAAREIVSHR